LSTVGKPATVKPKAEEWYTPPLEPIPRATRLREKNRQDTVYPQGSEREAVRCEGYLHTVLPRREPVGILGLSLHEGTTYRLDRGCCRCPVRVHMVQS
jgi:hypothetical protein